MISCASEHSVRFSEQLPVTKAYRVKLSWTRCDLPTPALALLTETEARMTLSLPLLI